MYEKELGSYVKSRISRQLAVMVEMSLGFLCKHKQTLGLLAALLNNSMIRERLTCTTRLSLFETNTSVSLPNPGRQIGI